MTNDYNFGQFLYGEAVPVRVTIELDRKTTNQTAIALGAAILVALLIALFIYKKFL